MKLVQAYATKNPCYVANVNKADSRYTTFQNRGPLGLVLHSVGCAQPSAMIFVNNWDKASYDRAFVHAFIDANNGTVYQLAPWNFRAWHAGGSANNTHVGIEMCEPSAIKYNASGTKFTITNKEKALAQCRTAYNAAVEQFAAICTQYNLDPLKDGVILSHKEAAKRGLASNHGDPEHLWSGLGIGYTMDGFRADVAKAMGKVVIEKPVQQPVQKEKEKTMVTINVQKLSNGDEGKAVKTLQQLLIAKGYSCGNAGADGDFGKGTYNAVITFQKNNGLVVDGVFGKNSWDKLLNG